jgi:endonuclease/exonuclease/phosphatase family metal-dependent hydrolase
MQSLRVMTYNVRSCRGSDGRYRPERIAKVIAAHVPDVIALQELDVMHPRSGGVDQPKLLAEELRMHCSFCAAFTTGDARYGHAVLSRFPLTTVRSSSLPTLDAPFGLERRAALWVEIDLGSTTLQLVNTHLGLRKQEKLLQAEALMGSDWLGHLRCVPPVVLLGDLNARPGSAVHRVLTTGLRDAWAIADRRGPRRTWPAPLALISIDHLFVSPRVHVAEVRASASAGARFASDHLPILAEIAVDEP